MGFERVEQLVEQLKEQPISLGKSDSSDAQRRREQSALIRQLTDKEISKLFPDLDALLSLLQSPSKFYCALTVPKSLIDRLGAEHLKRLLSQAPGKNDAAIDPKKFATLMPTLRTPLQIEVIDLVGEPALAAMVTKPGKDRPSGARIAEQFKVLLPNNKKYTYGWATLDAAFHFLAIVANGSNTTPTDSNTLCDELFRYTGSPKIQMAIFDAIEGLPEARKTSFKPQDTQKAIEKKIQANNPYDTFEKLKAFTLNTTEAPTFQSAVYQALCNTRKFPEILEKRGKPHGNLLELIELKTGKKIAKEAFQVVKKHYFIQDTKQESLMSALKSCKSAKAQLLLLNFMVEDCLYIAAHNHAKTKRATILNSVAELLEDSGIYKETKIEYLKKLPSSVIETFGMLATDADQHNLAMKTLDKIAEITEQKAPINVYHLEYQLKGKSTDEQIALLNAAGDEHLNALFTRLPSAETLTAAESVGRLLYKKRTGQTYPSPPVADALDALHRILHQLETPQLRKAFIERLDEAALTRCGGKEETSKLLSADGNLLLKAPMTALREKPKQAELTAKPAQPYESPYAHLETQLNLKGGLPPLVPNTAPSLTSKTNTPAEDTQLEQISVDSGPPSPTTQTDEHVSRPASSIPTDTGSGTTPNPTPPESPTQPTESSATTAPTSEQGNNTPTLPKILGGLSAGSVIGGVGLLIAGAALGFATAGFVPAMIGLGLLAAGIIGGGGAYFANRRSGSERSGSQGERSKSSARVDFAKGVFGDSVKNVLNAKPLADKHANVEAETRISSDAASSKNEPPPQKPESI